MTERVPTDADVPHALVRALDQITLQNAQMLAHSKQLTDYVARIDARVAGIETVAAVVDENETNTLISRHEESAKAIITHLYEKSQQYVTVVVGGSYAAYFATLSTIAKRFSDSELRLSALLMTISLTIFLLWEVGNIVYIGYKSLSGKFGKQEQSKMYLACWVAVLTGCLLTALPAIALSVYSYADNLINS